jgi:hypothetical protein
MLCDLQILFTGGIPWTIEIPLDDAFELIEDMRGSNNVIHWSQEFEDACDIYIKTADIMCAQITNIREAEGDVPA